MSQRALGPQFSDGPESPLENFGIPVVPAWQERDIRKHHRETNDNTGWQDVPIGSIRGGQHHIDNDKVRGMLANPPKESEDDILNRREGVRLPDGNVMLQDGHHRTVADKLRGAQSVRVKVKYGYGERYPGV